MQADHANRDLVEVAHALAGPARSRMVMLLLDGGTHSMGELAAAAKVAPASVTDHTRVLADAGIVTIEARGRQRLVAISEPKIADAIETLAAIAPARPIRGLDDSLRADALRVARTCYDHSAGLLGVALTRRLVEDGILEQPVPGTVGVVKNLDHPTLHALGVRAVDSSSRRPMVRSCNDLTEHRPHVAGALGRAVLDGLLRQKWVARRATTRALRITPAGEEAFHDLLGAWNKPAA
jgi:DNA-binding transcriptional ArsR family regulator